MTRSERRPPPNAKKKLSLNALALRVTELEQRAAEARRRETLFAQQFTDQVGKAVRVVEEEHNQAIMALQAENEQLKNELELAKPILAIGVDIRRRLFAHAKSSREPGDGDIIKQGNHAAHRGRPLADAVLCEHTFEPREHAREAYLSLYGVYPRWTLAWAHLSVVNDVLECRGSLVAEKISLSNTFQELFHQFISYIEEYGEAGVYGLGGLRTRYGILKEYDRLVAIVPGQKMLRST